MYGLRWLLTWLHSSQNFFCCALWPTVPFAPSHPSVPTSNALSLLRHKRHPNEVHASYPHPFSSRIKLHHTLTPQMNLLWPKPQLHLPLPIPPIHHHHPSKPPHTPLIANLQDLEITFPHRIRLILRLGHRVFDRLPPALSLEGRARRVKERPFYPVDGDGGEGSNVCPKEAEGGEVLEGGGQAEVGGEEAGRRSSIVAGLGGAGWGLSGTGGEVAEDPVRDWCG